MIDRDFPLDPEQELAEFITDISSERFLYEQWLERAATSSVYECSGFNGQLHTIPGFLRLFPGIAGNIEFGITATSTTESESVTIRRVTIRTQDTMDIIVENDHGIFLIHHDGRTWLAPNDATLSILTALFSERDCNRPTADLVRYIIEHSFTSRQEKIFEGIGMNDNSVRISLSTSEDDGNTSSSLEVTTTLTHPSSAFVGTRLTVYDSLLSAQAAIPLQAYVNIDVTRNGQNGEILTIATLLKQSGVSVPVKRPTHYHEGNIIEALYALELAAKEAVVVKGES